MNTISLMTDFSTRDGNVGVMKGVIWGIAPEAKIADLSHLIEPQNVSQAALILDWQVFYFPDNTVHIVVVDPGVGTQRRPIAAQIGSQRFVGPDNGIFTLLYERAEMEGWTITVVHTNKPKYWLPEISNVFHGRDIFSPVGAHLASGVPLEELGDLIDDPVRISIPKPQRTENGVRGEINHIDHFGNLISNIHQDDLAHLDDLSQVEVRLCGSTIEGIVRTFGEREPGELIALFDSTGYLFAAVVNGSGAESLNPKIGDILEVTPRNGNRV